MTTRPPLTPPLAAALAAAGMFQPAVAATAPHRPPAVRLVPLVSISSIAQDEAPISEAPANPDAANLPPKPSRNFGEAGGNWFSIAGGVAFADDSTDYNVPFTWHHFLADEFEVNLGLAAWYHDQDEGDEAASGSFSLGFRWHFLDDKVSDRYTVYGDIGIGVMGSSDEVPPDGTEFNFIPRAGIGATWRFSDGPARLDAGVRWQHISNASTSGADDNPARDAPMVYLGVVFPF